MQDLTARQFFPKLMPPLRIGYGADGCEDALTSQQRRELMSLTNPFSNTIVIKGDMLFQQRTIEST
ncbi:hypothetical protein LOC68_01625 [Blastopirellula sp. JC732]|uniref:Uncharacterized protein n=1 Tax=Blastopirellula sediminis TaxID=2894196 RepID=A0A9X1MKE3_9BACT|nr:hypothetical protein [Blastopirellula sediminis]MCC9608113.1 hypothetical protein [Blastopirellula sediminis]MCC9627094.1 hypothetical protein [Blastopirellula sediminis]